MFRRPKKEEKQDILIHHQAPKNPILYNSSLKFKFEVINDRQSTSHEGGISALAVLPDGNMLSGENYDDGHSGSIILRNSSGIPIKTLWKSGYGGGGVSALAVLPDGNILSGENCDDGYSGSIILRNSSGIPIRTLWESVDDPIYEFGISALAVLPDGNMLSGESYDDGRYGSIILRNAFGIPIRTLWESEDDPDDESGISALAVLSDGNILSGQNNDGGHNGRIILRNASGIPIRTLWESDSDEKGDFSALVVLPDGNILTAKCLDDGRYGSITLIKPTLVEKKQKFDPSINTLIDRAALACMQFHKGTLNTTNADVSPLCKLPADMLKLIYAYVFPFPNLKKEVVVNPNCFPYQTEKDAKKNLVVNEFVNKIFNIKFFSQPQPLKIEDALVEQFKAEKDVEDLNDGSKGKKERKHEKCSMM